MTTEPVANPDEIMLVDDEDEEDETPAEVASEEHKGEQCGCSTAENPDEISLEMEEEEEELSVTKVEPPVVAAGVVEAKVEEEKDRTTRFLALSKPGPGKDFLQVWRFLVLRLRERPFAHTLRYSDHRRPDPSWLRTPTSRAGPRTHHPDDARSGTSSSSTTRR